MKYIAVPIALILAGCTTAASTPTQDPPPATAPASSRLQHVHWQLQSATDRDGHPIDALLAHPEGPLQLDFSDRRLNVKHVCNAMSGTYHVSDGQLRVGPMIHTMMACADRSLMQMENAIAARLHAPLQVHISSGRSQPRLILTSANGDALTFVGTPAAATR